MEKEYIFKAQNVDMVMANGDIFTPCPQCGNHMVKEKDNHEGLSWLICLVCGLGCF